jgi:GTP-binding protein
MRIHQAEFVIGAVKEADLPPDGLPEVAFAGRSNVGKSSLINRLVQRRKLARTSSTPGKTQQLNYYRLNDLFYLVDLPGYGYVRGGAQLRRLLGHMVQDYIGGRESLRAVIQLVDARHGPTALDMDMIDWLRGSGKPFLVVFTKTDKLSRSQYDRQISRLATDGGLVGLNYAPFSAVTGRGRDDVMAWLLESCGLDGGGTPAS